MNGGRERWMGEWTRIDGMEEWIKLKMHIQEERQSYDL